MCVCYCHFSVPFGILLYVYVWYYQASVPSGRLPYVCVEEEEPNFISIANMLMIQFTNMMFLVDYLYLYL